MVPVQSTETGFGIKLTFFLSLVNFCLMRLDRFAILGLKNCILVDLWQKSSERNNDLPINDINYPTPTDLADIICVTLVMIL